MTTAPTTRYRRTDEVEAVSMDGELVMMGQQQGQYYGLRDVAASLWEHLAQPRSVDELCALVSEEYAVTAADCRADVQAFLDELVAKDLVSASA
jgi:hypothetical protein